jgi:hypothetical protein
MQVIIASLLVAKCGEDKATDGGGEALDTAY